MIGVREPVGARARLGDDRALLEREHGLGGAHDREQRLDRLPALRVRERVCRAVRDRELDAFCMRKAHQQRGRVQRRGAKLEVRRAPERQRPRAEKCSAQVRRSAAAAGDDLPRRQLQWRVATVHHPGRHQHLERFGVARDVELVPRRRVEGATAIGADLRPDAALPQQRERAACGGTAAEVEVQTPVARAAEMQAAGGVEQCGELRPAVAVAVRSDGRKLFADVLGRDQRRTPSSASRRRLTSIPAAP